MYKPYLSRQKSGKSVQTRDSRGWRDKTTLKLVTEQLRASQKVLNKSDQIILGPDGYSRSAPAAPSALGLSCGPIRSRHCDQLTNERGRM